MSELSARQIEAIKLLHRLESEEQDTSFYRLSAHRILWATLRALQKRKMVTGKFPGGAIAGTYGSMVWRLTDAARTYAAKLAA